MPGSGRRSPIRCAAPTASSWRSICLRRRNSGKACRNAFERPDLGADERFAAREGRIENYFALKAEFQKTVGTEPRAHWMARLEAEDVPFAPILSLPEVREDPQVRHLETFFETDHPSEGAMTLLRRPVRFDGARDDQPTAPPPQLGEHTDEILGELGFDADGIERLRRDAVV